MQQTAPKRSLNEIITKSVDENLADFMFERAKIAIYDGFLR
jgi:hypothetical protein